MDFFHPFLIFYLYKEAIMKPIDTSFIPKSNIAYPAKTDMHYIKIKKNRNIKFDKNYPYVNNSKWFCFKKALVRLFDAC